MDRGPREPLRAVIAQPDAPDTDTGMSPASQASYAAKNRTDHQVRAIRPSMLLAPDSPRPRPGGDKTADGPGADVVALPPSRPRRDRTERLGAIVPLDANNRVFATKLLAALDWDTDTDLVAEVRGNTAVVRVGVRTRDRAWLQPTRVDRSSRLRIPPGVKGALQVRTGEQVVVCAVPATGELHLSSAADVLQDLAGEITPETTPETTTADTGAERPRTRVRAAVAFTD